MSRTFPLKFNLTHDVRSLQAELHLCRAGIKCERIDGSVTAIDRQAAVQRINTDPSSRVMLLSLRAGGVGLNLTGANHLFLLDMHWNPALEAQACDRVYRVGQLRPVTVHRLLCTNTIEERIAALQVITLISIRGSDIGDVF